MGGASISIHGNGYLEVPSDNSVQFEIENSEIKGQVLSGHALTEENELESSSHSGILSYNVPSVEDLTGSSIDNFANVFTGDLYFNAQVQVHYQEDVKVEVEQKSKWSKWSWKKSKKAKTTTKWETQDVVLACTTGHECDVKYRYLYTP